MKLIYKNSYGATYRVDDFPNPKFKYQMTLATIAIYLTDQDINHLLEIIKSSKEPCICDNCYNERCNKIWTTNSLVDICLKVNDEILELMEDLIKGTQFTLKIDDILDQHRIKN